MGKGTEGDLVEQMEETEELGKSRRRGWAVVGHPPQSGALTPETGVK